MKVSVICTSYNKEKWLPQAIESIVNQDCTFDYELLIIDDASTDSSAQIIQAYQKKYPNLIKFLINQENLGITRTWKKICLEAKGDYIARLDADDFWTDPHKLQKQVDCLEASEISRWCVTDFDIVDQNGDLIQSAAIKSGTIRKMSSFEDELAFKGMTMSSTWLVERQLMLEVNKKIPDDAIDDTFNIQLEFFLQTIPTFLSDVTSSYRLLSNSDSHLEDFSKISNRLDNLYRTQQLYLETSSNLNTKQFALALLEELNGIEKYLAQKSLELKMTSDYAKSLEQEKTILVKDKEALLQENQRVYEVLSADRDKWYQDYQQVVNSRRWKILSKISNLFRGKE